MTTPVEQTVLILGAGLTGQAVAHLLDRQGYRVILLDHPDWQDGYGLNATDAAPILFGRHQATWHLLRSLDGNASAQPDRMAPLEFRLPDGRIAAYQSTHLPGALQWMTSLFSFHGLSWRDRWSLFSHLEQIWEQAQSLPPDLDNRLADEWLTSIGQSQEARQSIWSPLVQWLTGNELGRLSAAVFVRQLSILFLGRTMDARLTLLYGSIADRFFLPLKKAAAQRQNAQILASSQVPVLRFGPDGVNGARLHDGAMLQARWYVSALSQRTLVSLLPERLLTRYAYFAQISDLEALSQITVRFTCRSRMVSSRLLLLAGRPFHDLTVTPVGPDEMHYRLSAIGNPLMELDDDQLTSLGRTELGLLVPEIKQKDIHSVEIDRRIQAALSLKPGASLLRPIQQSPVGNLLIAGAWTDTGWPANVESAIVSAQRCAEIIAGQPA